MLLSRKNQLLLEFSFWNEPVPRSGPNIYELRSYQLRVSAFSTLLECVLLKWRKEMYLPRLGPVPRGANSRLPVACLCSISLQDDPCKGKPARGREESLLRLPSPSFRQQDLG